MTVRLRANARVGAVALAVLFALAGCKGAATGIDKGDKAPDFVLPRLDGTVQKLSNYRGSVVLVNFWATWCPPCIEEMPVLNRISADYENQGLVVLGLAGDDDVGRINDFVAKEPLGFEVLHDPGGAIGTLYGITGYPETFVIDRDGMVASKMIGPLPADGHAPSAELAALLAATVAKGK